MALSESYTSKNGMLRVHYPSEFAAKSTEHGGVVLARNLSFGEDGSRNLYANMGAVFVGDWLWAIGLYIAAGICCAGSCAERFFCHKPRPIGDPSSGR